MIGDEISSGLLPSFSLNQKKPHVLHEVRRGMNFGEVKVRPPTNFSRREKREWGQYLDFLSLCWGDDQSNPQLFV
ncbi:hypothetical protein WA1_45970 [Scytonema hofmannii PCC 7110]|uniref:Uncharacterized protein n=1 Tax=Scytonema hofmannii PCC 7110 TaxID=128403 RepID=A0A139WX36_9CYAN|nr:hypothetical protein WA1_45970 [Scytonema hofmannii PCC 7110]